MKLCDEAVRRVFPENPPDWSEMTKQQRMQVIFWTVRLDSTYGASSFEEDVESLFVREPANEPEGMPCSVCGNAFPEEELNICDECGESVCTDCWSGSDECISLPGLCKSCQEDLGEDAEAVAEEEE